MPIVNDMKQETLFSFKDTVEADSTQGGPLADSGSPLGRQGCFSHRVRG